MTFYKACKPGGINELMERCAQAMYDDTECNFQGNGCNAYEAAGALDEVADILCVPGPSYILKKLYEQDNDQ